MRNGITINISEDFFNVQIKGYLMSVTHGYLKDYHFILVGDSIIFEGKANVPKLGALKVSYRFCIEDFIFNKTERRIELSYLEDVRCENDPIATAALAFMKRKGTVLSTAVEHSKVSGIMDSNGRIIIDLYKFSALDIINKIPENITAKFISCDAGNMSIGINLA